MHMKSFAIGAALALGLTTGAGAALASSIGDLTINSVAGVWSGPYGSPDDFVTVAPNEIRWGDPLGSNNINNIALKSGYRFDAPAVLPVGPLAPNGGSFGLGTFTHFNNPIVSDSISGATLTVTFGVNYNNGTPGGENRNLVSVYRFTHFETPNNGNPCAAGGSQPCPDLVTAVINTALSDSIQIGNAKFFLSITGFKVGDNVLGSFLTKEEFTNVATLQGRWTSEVAPIPLPMGAWFALTGLAGAVALRRRKAQAA
jgi:hypothetical protein